MTFTINHLFVNPKADGGDNTITRPSDWNANLVTSMATAQLLGRQTAGVGVVEEIPIGAWTAFTCVAVPGSGVITSQTSSSTYLQIGKIVFIAINVTITNVGTGTGGFTLSLPVMAKISGAFLPGRERGLSGKMLSGVITGANDVIAPVNYDNSITTFATNAIYDIGGTYEAA